MSYCDIYFVKWIAFVRPFKKGNRICLWHDMKGIIKKCGNTLHTSCAAALCGLHSVYTKFLNLEKTKCTNALYNAKPIPFCMHCWVGGSKPMLRRRGVFTLVGLVVTIPLNSHRMVEISSFHLTFGYNNRKMKINDII